MRDQHLMSQEKRELFLQEAGLTLDAGQEFLSQLERD